MKNIIKVIAMAAVAMSPAAIYGQLLIQQMNEDGVISTTTATGGKHWRLSGTIHDLSQFSGTGNTAAENPFGWDNWVNYGSVSVVDGVWQGTATAASPQMLTAANAYSFDMGTFRYLEITIRKESPVGSGVVRFRKDGNSIAESGQIGHFAIVNEASADISNKQNTFILDMHEIAAWTGGNMTGLALQLHEGQGNSVIGTTDYLYSVRLGTDISDTDPGDLLLILERSVDLQNWHPISVTPSSLNEAGAVIRQSDEANEFFRLRIETNNP